MIRPAALSQRAGAGDAGGVAVAAGAGVAPPLPEGSPKKRKKFESG